MNNIYIVQLEPNFSSYSHTVHMIKNPNDEDLEKIKKLKDMLVFESEDDALNHILTYRNEEKNRIVEKLRNEIKSIERRFTQFIIEIQSAKLSSL